MIAVLVAISIPIFSSQLEKAREATDLANIRAAYAECAAEAITADTATTTSVSKSVKIKQTTSGWVTAFDEVGGVPKASIPNVTNTDTVYVIVPTSGDVAQITTTAPTDSKNKSLDS